MNVGVIGIGTVGYPLYKTLQYYHKNDVYCWDIEKPCDDWEDILRTDITFISVPTNGGIDGRLDMRIVDEVLEKLDKGKYNGITVIKSTLRLGYINNIIKKYQFKIMVFPEWLRALHAFPDTLNPEMTVIGDEKLSEGNIKKVLDACIWHDEKDVLLVLPEEAVMIKLTANALAATKISFANQIQLICESYNISAETVMNAIKNDPRCAPRYLKPGKSFDGSCLPKDTLELLNSVDNNYLFRGVDEINEFFKRKEGK